MACCKFCDENSPRDVESSSEGSHCRCKSLAAKAPIAAVDLIHNSEEYFADFYAAYLRMVRCAQWFAIIVVLGRMEQTAAIVPITARYCTLCNEPGHRQKRARCKFRVCNKCGAAGHSATECTQTGCNECGSTTHETAMSFACPEHKCTNCEGTLEPKGHNRSDCPRMQRMWQHDPQKRFELRVS